MTGPERTFPIRLDDRISTIPWALLEPHEPQAYRNHSQSIVRLAARGGLTPEEAVAILEDREWQALPNTYAVLRLKELVAEHLGIRDGLSMVGEARSAALTRGIALLERMRDGHTAPHRGLYNELIAILEACK